MEVATFTATTNKKEFARRVIVSDFYAEHGHSDHDSSDARKRHEHNSILRTLGKSLDDDEYITSFELTGMGE